MDNRPKSHTIRVFRESTCISFPSDGRKYLYFVRFGRHFGVSVGSLVTFSGESLGDVGVRTPLAAGRRN